MPAAAPTAAVCLCMLGGLLGICLDAGHCVQLSLLHAFLVVRCVFLQAKTQATSQAQQLASQAQLHAQASVQAAVQAEQLKQTLAGECCCDALRPKPRSIPAFALKTCDPAQILDVGSGHKRDCLGHPFLTRHTL